MLDGKHDPPPDGGSINHLFAFLHGIKDVLRGSRRLDGKRGWAPGGLEHFRFHEAGFYRQDIHAAA